MRVSNAEKERSRERIITAASRLFRAGGVEGASVGDVMRAAGMTHGGFYRHFEDKEALLAAALTAAFEEFARPLLEGPAAEAAAARNEFRTHYLSEEHRADPAAGCPAAALGPEVARARPEVRAAFSRGVERVAEGLARGRATSGEGGREALRDLATLVGAIVLARAVDDELARAILGACAPDDARR
jgi:TetR/AcrR family transcriptional regulator, transcriptional repressor for nem operon